MKKIKDVKKLAKCDVCGVNYVRFILVDMKTKRVRYYCGLSCLLKNGKD